MSRTKKVKQVNPEKHRHLFPEAPLGKSVTNAKMGGRAPLTLAQELAQLQRLDLARKMPPPTLQQIQEEEEELDREFSPEDLPVLTSAELDALPLKEVLEKLQKKSGSAGTAPPTGGPPPPSTASASALSAPSTRG